MSASDVIDKGTGFITREAETEPGNIRVAAEEQYANYQYSIGETHDELNRAHWPGIVFLVAICAFIAVFLWLTKAHEMFH